jgi:hypothetical protein
VDDGGITWQARWLAGWLSSAAGLASQAAPPACDCSKHLDAASAKPPTPSTSVLEVV